jgi:hypothetical protein
MEGNIVPFTAIYGLPGRGKSLLMLQRALLLAEKYGLRIVSNFQLDPIQLAYYCKINNYKWLMGNIPKGIIYYVSANQGKRILTLTQNMLQLNPTKFQCSLL